jgi:hypothetical protein
MRRASSIRIEIEIPCVCGVHANHEPNLHALPTEVDQEVVGSLGDAMRACEVWARQLTEHMPWPAMQIVTVVLTCNKEAGVEMGMGEYLERVVEAMGVLHADELLRRIDAYSQKLSPLPAY